MIIEKAGKDRPPSRLTGRLSYFLEPWDISAVLGLEPNVEDDPAKVKYSWAFTIQDDDGLQHCAIWDYYGARWSTFGPVWKLTELFHKEYNARQETERNT